MFKFDFDVQPESETESKKDELQSTVTDNVIEWLDSKEINLTAGLDIELGIYELNSNTITLGDTKIFYVNPTFVLKSFITCPSKIPDIQKAEDSHTDLIPGVYEGGAKLWECTQDLLSYMNSNFPHDEWKTKNVLDLGCGAGLLGIYALKFDSDVHFQDYNEDVLRKITIPNVLLNSDFDEADNDFLAQLQSKTKFFSGDWTKYTSLTELDCKFDFILTSETVYNVQNYEKLLNTFAVKLKVDGVVLVAAKTYYFGVGGGVRQFEKLIKEDNRFNVKTVWVSSNGVNREILELRRVPFS